METFNPHCSICFDNYNGNSSLAAMRCGHVYHRNCLLQWFKHRQTCPTCNYREILPFKRWMNIYLDHTGRSETPSSALSDQNTRELQRSDQYWMWNNVLGTFIVPLVSISVAFLLFVFIINRTTWSPFDELEIDKLKRVIEELRDENQKVVDNYRKLSETQTNCFFFGFLFGIIISLVLSLV